MVVRFPSLTESPPYSPLVRGRTTTKSGFAQRRRYFAIWFVSAARRTRSAAWTAIGIDKDHFAHRNAPPNLDIGQVDESAARYRPANRCTRCVLTGATGERRRITDGSTAISAVGIQSALAAASFANPGAQTSRDAFLVLLLAGLIG